MLSFQKNKGQVSARCLLAPSVTTGVTFRMLNMPATHHHSSFSFLTVCAAALTVCGIGLTFNDVQWQLISMASFFSGLGLAVVACLFHVIRRHRAWRIEGAILVSLMALVWSAPLLPPAMQDTLVYLMP